MKSLKDKEKLDVFKDLRSCSRSQRHIRILAYYTALLPFVAYLINCVMYCCFDTNSAMGLLNYQFIYAGEAFLLISLYFEARKFANIDFVVANYNPKNVKSTIARLFKTYPEVIALAALLVWMIFSSFFHPNSFSIFHFITSTTFHLQTGVIFYFFAAACLWAGFRINDTKVRKHIVYTVVCAITFCVLTSLIDPKSELLINQNRNTFWASMFLNSNHFGYMLTMLISITASVFCLSEDKKLKYTSLAVMIIATITAFFNDTLGAQLALFLGLIILPIVFSLFKRKFKVIYLAPLGIFVALSFATLPFASKMNSLYTSFFKQVGGLMKDIFNITHDPLSEATAKAGTNRWGLWLKAVQDILEHPIVGRGNVFFKPHNEYLELAGHFGIPALIAYLTALVIIYVKAIKHYNKMSNFSLVLLFAVGVYLIDAFFGNIMPHTTPFYCLILGICIKQVNHDIALQPSPSATNNNTKTNS